MEKKYRAIGKNRLVLPFTLLDESGKTVVNRSITFNPGSRSMGAFNPATYISREKEEIEFLDNFIGNKANGGFLFEEVKIKTPTAKPTVKKAEPIKKEPETEEEVPEEEVPEEVSEESTFENVTNIQEAAMILRGINSDLKANDLRSKVAVLRAAEELNVSFPNL
jgi:hypothetical protein